MSLDSIEEFPIMDGESMEDLIYRIKTLEKNFLKLAISFEVYVNPSKAKYL